MTLIPCYPMLFGAGSDHPVFFRDDSVMLENEATSFRCSSLLASKRSPFTLIFLPLCFFKWLLIFLLFSWNVFKCVPLERE